MPARARPRIIWYTAPLRSNFTRHISPSEISSFPSQYLDRVRRHFGSTKGKLTLLGYLTAEKKAYAAGDGQRKSIPLSKPYHQREAFLKTEPAQTMARADAGAPARSVVFKPGLYTKLKNEATR